MKVLLVGGSPRAKGNTDTLLTTMHNEFERHGVSATVAFLRDYSIAPCIGCEQCRTDKTCRRFLDGMHLLYPEIESSAGLVLASPTYNYNITPMTKAFIDRMYPYFNFTEPRPGPYSSRLADRPRVAVTLGICEQNEASEMGVTMPALTDPLRPLGYKICDQVTITGHFYRGSVREDSTANERVRAAARSLVHELGHG